MIERAVGSLALRLILLLYSLLFLAYDLNKVVEYFCNLRVHCIYLIVDLLLDLLEALVVLVPQSQLRQEAVFKSGKLLLCLSGLQCYSLHFVALWFMDVQAFFTNAFEILLAEEEKLIAWMFETEAILELRVLRLQRIFDHAEGTLLLALSCIHEGESLVGVFAANGIIIFIAHC